MRTILSAVVLAVCAFGQMGPASKSGGTTVTYCNGTTVTTNCVQKLDSSGNLNVGSRVVAITIGSGTAALATAAIASGACASAVTVSATGVLTTDVIQPGFNGDPTGVTGYIPSTSGMLTIIPYPTADNVNFKVCNNTGSSITPGAITLNWRVSR